MLNHEHLYFYPFPFFYNQKNWNELPEIKIVETTEVKITFS